MYRFIAATLAVFFCLTSLPEAGALDDLSVSYQGTLTDDAGVPAEPDIYDFQFSIYKELSGGSPLWSTVEAVDVGAKGLFSVILGPISIDVFSDPADPVEDGLRYLQITLLPDEIFEPRTPVTATPYSAVAGRLDGDLTTDDGIISMIDTTGDTIRAALVNTSGGGGGASLSLQSFSPLGETFGSVIANAGAEEATFRLFQPLAPDPSIELIVGDFNPMMVLYDDASGDTSAILSMFELRFPTSSGYGRTVNSATTYSRGGLYSIDTTGDTILAVSSDGDIVTSGTVQSGNSIVVDGIADQIRVSAGELAIGLDPSEGSFSNIMVGIGTEAPVARLDVNGSTKTLGFVMLPGAADGYVLTSNASGIGSWQPPSGGGANGWVDTGPVYLETETDSVGIGTSNPIARLHVESEDIYGGYFRASYPSTGTSAINAQYDGPAGTYDARGIYAKSKPQDNFGIGGYFEGGYNGVYGKTISAGSAMYTGVRGRASGGSGSNYAVHATALNSTDENIGVFGMASATDDLAFCYGIYGSVDISDSGYAGYFDGNVWITGNLYKGSGSFTIDHPLDPENKYLLHSFVESPDMMNVYNGNITTDANGDAVVTLPDYFEALNKDFRYQLTVIGQFAQAIVAEKISGGQFSIKTDKPNVEVSWQVTGVRQDPYANANRIPVEMTKRADQRGRYMHPESYGLDKSRSIDYRHRDVDDMHTDESTNR